MDPLRLEFAVTCPPDRAFALVAARVGSIAAERRERNERGWSGVIEHYVRQASR
jgi:hypothetical protein